jgi:hypothetical protein
MECCSPDVGDCRKCHPELWKKAGLHWVSKEFHVETRRPRKTRRQPIKQKGTRKVR